MDEVIHLLPNAATASQQLADSVSLTGSTYYDGLITGSKWDNSSTISYAFMTPTDTSLSWSDAAKTAFNNAFQLFSNVANISFQQTTDQSASSIKLNLSSELAADLYGWFGFPDGSGTGGVGTFNALHPSWTADQLQYGGDAFQTVIHELGHGMGLAHPHDNGGISTIFPGVTGSSGSYGDYNMNQGIYTMMTYNNGIYTDALPSSAVYGREATPMALDIGVLQLFYGANTSYATGNNYYDIPDSNAAGTYYSCVWDCGGSDTIRYTGSKSVTIDLRAATMTGQYAGGYVSKADGVAGGFTIAKDVVVENIVAGSGDDVLTGNGAANTITGNGGADVIDGGRGFDTAVFSGTKSDYTVTRSGGVVTVAGSTGTSRLTGVERLQFSDAADVGAGTGPQTLSTAVTGASGGTALSFQQVAITETVDSSRGALASKVQVNGQDISGVPSTLKKGWKVAAVADVSGDGTPELFFFGVESVNGVGSGFGATWSINSSGAVSEAKIQLQMSRQGWDAAGAANVNDIAGDEIIWQNTLTGSKAIWTDADGNGTYESGFVLSELGTDTAERIIGVSDINKNGKKEFLLYDESGGGMKLYEAAPLSNGSVTPTLLGGYAAFEDFTTAATAAGASYTIFNVVC